MGCDRHRPLLSSLRYAVLLCSAVPLAGVDPGVLPGPPGIPDPGTGPGISPRQPGIDPGPIGVPDIDPGTPPSEFTNCSWVVLRRTTARPLLHAPPSLLTVVFAVALVPGAGWGECTAESHGESGNSWW